MKSIFAVAALLLSILIETITITFTYLTTYPIEITLGALCFLGFIVVVRKVFLIKITVHPATKKTFNHMVKCFQRESMFCEERIPNATIDIEHDADLTTESVRKEIKLVKSSRRVPYAVRVAHVAKAQVGLLSDCKANELVYARLCREEMIKHGVRPSHIAHMVPLAVAACFIPLDSDFLAHSIRSSKLFKERRGLVGMFGSK